MSLYGALRKIGWWIGLLALILVTGAVSAQSADYQPYAWTDADLALVYPSSWDVPSPLKQDDRSILRLAQVFAAHPTQRPPAADSITLTVVSDGGETKLSTSLAAALGEQGTPWIGDSTGALIAGVQGEGGTGHGGLLFGVARAARLDDRRLLLVVGRSTQERRNAFLILYDAVVASLSPGADSTPAMPEYGVLWRVTEAEGTPLGELNALALQDGVLVAVDATRGALRLDAQTGEVSVVQHDSPPFTNATDAALDHAQVAWLADPLCACVEKLNLVDGSVMPPLTQFYASAPTSLVFGDDNTLYATDAGNMGIVIHAITPTQDRAVPVEHTIAQPELAMDRSGRLLAVTDEGAVLALGKADRAFQHLFDLVAPVPHVTDLAVDLDNNLVLATADQGVLVVNSAGKIVERLGDVVTGAPEAGQFVSPRGVVVAEDGTIYVADDDGTHGSITALSLRVAPERVGESALVPDHTVRGTLTAQASQQMWTLAGQRGQQVTLSAVGAGGADALPLVLRLFAPDGTQETSTEIQDDALIANHALAVDGTYTVVVEPKSGEGIYWLGFSLADSFAPGANATDLSGRLSEAMPVHFSRFNGGHGQVYTFTAQATSGDLDPALKLIAPDGSMVAENDDADDPALGKSAQLAHVTLPVDGTYTLEISRSTGGGAYRITIVQTSG